MLNVICLVNCGHSVTWCYTAHTISEDVQRTLRTTTGYVSQPSCVHARVVKSKYNPGLRNYKHTQYVYMDNNIPILT